MILWNLVFLFILSDYENNNNEDAYSNYMKTLTSISKLEFAMQAKQMNLLWPKIYAFMVHWQ